MTRKHGVIRGDEERLLVASYAGVVRKVHGGTLAFPAPAAPGLCTAAVGRPQMGQICRELPRFSPVEAEYPLRLTALIDPSGRISNIQGETRLGTWETPFQTTNTKIFAGGDMV